MPDRRRRVSAEDVAREAGVSRTTVSFVLNNTPGKGITESTRQRVLDAANRLGYEPNEYARRLARTANLSVGVLVCHSQFAYSDVFITRVLEGMSQVANRFRARLSLEPVRINEPSYLDLAGRYGFDGIILINAHEADEALMEVADRGFPAVSMDDVGEISVDQVYVDNEAAAEEMTTYLLNLGHRRIAFIGHAPSAYYSSQKRLGGYRRALEWHGVEFDDSLVRFADFTERSGYEQMDHVIEHAGDVDAVFAGNDVVAYGVIRALKNAGHRIPEDTSVAGFDDDYVSRFLNPPLTTMALPASSYGAAAVEMLMERVVEPDGPQPRTRILKARMSVRGSCAPPRQAG